MKIARILAAPTLVVAGLLFLAPCQNAGTMPPVQTAGPPGIHVGSRVFFYSDVSGHTSTSQAEVVSVADTWVQLRSSDKGSKSSWWVNFAHVTMYGAGNPEAERGNK